MCFRDMAFCASKVKKHTCGRGFTKQDAKDAEKWWGGKDYPVAYGKFCEEAADDDSSKDGVGTSDPAKATPAALTQEAK